MQPGRTEQSILANTSNSLTAEVVAHLFAPQSVSPFNVEWLLDLMERWPGPEVKK